MVRHKIKPTINRKKIHRILKINGWQMRKQAKGMRPGVKGYRSIAVSTNVRWAIDTTTVMFGRDGWGHLTAIIDCYDRQIVGWRFSRNGVAGIAAAALGDALRDRKPANHVLVSSYNGLVFGSKAFSHVVKRHGLTQEFTTPYTPEQNGMIERFFRSIKEECIWMYNFASKDEAFRIIADWIDWYNQSRPHSVLVYRSPLEFRTLKAA
jgi:putative transposase